MSSPKPKQPPSRSVLVGMDIDSVGVYGSSETQREGGSRTRQIWGKKLLTVSGEVREVNGKSVGSSRELWLGSREDQRTSFLRSTDMLFSAIPWSVGIG